VLQPPCAWIVSTPDACAQCALNPRNKPVPSASLRFLYYLESLQGAGAMLHYNDLRPKEWRAMSTLKYERQRFELEQLKKNRK
jgi:hypothetical protein